MFQPVYLASQSPRRRELLQQIAVDFSVIRVDTDESVLSGETPLDYVARVAQDKAKAGIEQIVNRADKRPVLAADTAVVLGNQIFGKPENTADARQMLEQLSGRTHQVMSAVSLMTEQQHFSAVCVSDVSFARLSPQELDWYVATGEGVDKAGAYAVQGYAALFIEKIRGSYSGIMGLPLRETGQLLKRMDDQ